MLAQQDRQEKEFIYRHSRTVFELLDTDGSNNISGEEFENFGFLFNFDASAVNQIFREFDVSGDQVCVCVYACVCVVIGSLLQELDYQEFRMFAMACIDRQNEMKEKRERQTLLSLPSCQIL